MTTETEELMYNERVRFYLGGTAIASVAAVVALAVVSVVAGALAPRAAADAPPVGPLPGSPVSTIVSAEGELVAIALPRRKGLSWRIARAANPRVLAQVSEGNVGSNLVLVFRAAGPGATSLALGLTRGETAKALDARRFTVRVR